MKRLSVSNLAWPQQCEPEIFCELSRLGVRGVEVAPTRVADWDNLSPAVLHPYRQRLHDAGLSASSLQAILFGTRDLSLLGTVKSFDAMLEHMRRVTEIAAVLGAEILVFGAPRNRLRGDLTVEHAWTLARDRWNQLGDVVATAGIAIGIEPVPLHYGGDFLTHWADVLRMVQEVDHPGIRVHLDTACIALGGDNIGEAVTACIPWLEHFHAAQVDLANFAEPLSDHMIAARALRDAGYARWIAIEMREPSGDATGTIKAAVNAVKEIYGF